VCDVTYKNLQDKTPVLIAVYNSGPARLSTIQAKVPHAKVQGEKLNFVFVDFLQAFHADGSPIPTDVICANDQDPTDCELFFFDNFKSYDTAYYYLQSGSESNAIGAQEIKFNQDYNINPSQAISVYIFIFLIANRGVDR